MNKTNKAFTLVELIVVITILAILGTIAFISLQGYSKKARDSKRIADISNIKTSLELFSLNTGYYPTPDNGAIVEYDGDLLWTQGIVGSNVTTNLSRNLLKKPTDPLHDIEYVYSLASSKKEYEVMSIHEGDLATNNLLNSTYASDKYNVKVEGNYNELFVKTSRHIFPVPSIITSATIPLDFDLVPSAIESQVITGGANFPGLNIPNTETSTGGLKMTLSVYTGSINKDSEDNDKKEVVEKIQLAYSGSDVATSSIYKTLLEKTEDDELLAFVDDVILNKTSSVVSEISDTEAPTGGDFIMDTEISSVDITLTITCPEEDLVEMYIAGDIVNTSEWETCVSSKDIELTSGDGSKNISVKWRDDDENESDSIDKIIELSTWSCPTGAICGDNYVNFLTPGIYNFNYSGFMGEITVRIVGGGGQGGGSRYVHSHGGGGGGGAYREVIGHIPDIDNIEIIVGKGGDSGGNTGEKGGDSKYGNYMIVGGGSGGSATAGCGGSATGGNGGSGSGIGYGYSGGKGGIGYYASNGGQCYAGGFGGTSGRSNSNGEIGINGTYSVADYSGTCGYGVNMDGTKTSSIGCSSRLGGGQNNTKFGSGGAGAGRGSDPYTQSGAKGGNGFVIIEW